jgi:hypothetical protein
MQVIIIEKNTIHIPVIQETDLIHLKSFRFDPTTPCRPPTRQTSLHILNLTTSKEKFRM